MENNKLELFRVQAFKLYELRIKAMELILQDTNKDLYDKYLKEFEAQKASDKDYIKLQEVINGLQ